MYFLDPEQGKRRQAEAVDHCAQLAAQGVRWFDRASRDLSNRAQGAWHEVLGSLDTLPATDEVLTARVRSRLGRAVSHPRAIEVDVADGVVSLSGPVLADEAEFLLACVRSVNGVSEVQDDLSRHDEDEGIPQLQGGASHDENDLPIFARSPGMRLAAGTVGGLLMANCVLKRRPMSILLGAVGFALLAQATSSHPSTAGRSAGGRKQRTEEESDDADVVDDTADNEPNSAAEESMHGEETDGTEMSGEGDAGSAAEVADRADDAPMEEVQVAYSAELSDEISNETAETDRRAKSSKKSDLERAELGEA
jgi:hypothetical protein